MHGDPGPPCIFRRSSFDVVQVWLQSRQTRLTLRMPTRAVSICQVDDLKLLRPGSELLVTNDHNDGPGALLVGVLCRLGLASFSRLGPFCAAIWFCGLRLMFCRGRGVRGHAAGQGDGCGGRRLQNLTIVLVCVCLFASVSCFAACYRRWCVACRQSGPCGALGSRMPPPLQPSRASVCMGGFCARERLSVTVTVRIVLGLRLTRALSCERCF